MADTPDQSKDESRPFLASDDSAHQAKLMNDTKKPGKGSHDDSPAPILPPIVNHPSTSEPPKPTNANHQPTDNTQTTGPSNQPAPEPDIPLPIQSDPEINQSKPESKNRPPGLYPSSQKAIAGLVVAVTALIGFSAIWYNLNQDIYTLGSQQPSTVADNPTPSHNHPATLGAEDNQSTLNLSLANLPALEQGHYQLWIEQDDQPASLGTFTIKDGQAVDAQGQAFQPSLDQAVDQAKLLISIESGDKETSTPSASIILTGKLKDSQAQLTFQAIDLSKANGSFVIAAPSDLSGDYQHSGLWFAKTNGQDLTDPSLNIPNAPKGWKYEGQVVYKGTAIAMGRFSQPDQTDDFYGFTPNPDHIPTNFPGEDYLEGQPDSLGLDFPADLTTGEWKVVISIEPDLDGQDPTGDKTFFLQPLSAQIPQDAQNYKEYDLKLDTSKFPTATVTIK